MSLGEEGYVLISLAIKWMKKLNMHITNIVLIGELLPVQNCVPCTTYWIMKLLIVILLLNSLLHNTYETYSHGACSKVDTGDDK